MPQDATDEQILAAYENGPSRSLDEENDEELYKVERLTLTAFTDRINDNDCAFG